MDQNDLSERERYLIAAEPHPLPTKRLADLLVANVDHIGELVDRGIANGLKIDDVPKIANRLIAINPSVQWYLIRWGTNLEEWQIEEMPPVARIKKAREVIEATLQERGFIPTAMATLAVLSQFSSAMQASA